jgi:SAM-dependent methyltransferase
MIIYSLSLIYSSSMGSPYVPSKQKEVDFILKEAGLKKGKIFLELGCGDGRMVRTAVVKYGVYGIGIDINPVIIFYAKIIAKTQKINNLELRVENIFNAKLDNADYIYLFLMPDLLKKIMPLMKKQMKKNTLVISHGFKLIGWEKYLIKTISHSPFPTYFYKIT